MRIDTFVKKAIGKVDAQSFLAEHRNYLCGFRSCLPVLAQLENKEIFPTGALQQILTLLSLEKDPVIKDVETVDKRTGEVIVKSVAQLEAEQEKAKKKDAKKYSLFLYVQDGSGGEFCREVLDADLWQDAENISYRTLFKNEDAVYMDIYSGGVMTRIHRNVAVGKYLNGKLGGKIATKRTSKRSSGLHWGGKVKNSTARFSKG